MGCEEIRQILEESSAQELPALVRDHLGKCSGCYAHARDWRLVRAGFGALAEAEVPEAPLGFAARLARRLQDTAEPLRSGADYLEQAGRRFVYAALLFTLMLLLALVLPSTGPLRVSPTADFYFAQTEVTPAESDSILAPDFQDTHDAAPAKLTSEGEKGQR